MSLLADKKAKRQEKFNREFISLFDSVLYVGEPLGEALEYVIDCMPYQSKLYLTVDGCKMVSSFNERDEYGELSDNFMWIVGDDEFFKEPINTDEIITELKKCVQCGSIDNTSPIYNLGFGKKRFLEYLKNDDFDVCLSDLEDSQSPTPINDDFSDIDFYTFQSVMSERDELREKLKHATAPKIIKGQGDNLLVLGAVLTILESESVNPYTQTKLIDKIVKKCGSGLSESTLTKKFAESKKYFKQNQ